MRVKSEMTETDLLPLPLHAMSVDVWLLRMRFKNNGARTGTFFAKIEDLEGDQRPNGPEVPWWVIWRHGGSARTCRIPGGSSEFLLIGEARGLIPGQEWIPSFHFHVAATEDEPIRSHEAIMTEDHLVAVLKVWHQETDSLVETRRIDLFWKKLDNGTYKPKMVVTDHHE